MADLFLHGRQVRTVFDLLGDKENDITFSIGWALAQCDGFLTLLLKRLFAEEDVGETQAVQLQQSGGSGFTDIEIITSHVHVIVEAKRGWGLPEDIEQQITRYARRFTESSRHSRLVVMSEAADYYALARLPQQVNGIPVHYLSWRAVAALAVEGQRASAHAEKRLLQELVSYFSGIMTLQNQTSNQVYVVAVAGGTPDWSALSWQDIVTQWHRYFHPVGGSGWPKTPPNYIGFRYGGRLQSIHHVDSYIVVPDREAMAAALPAMPSATWEAQNLFSKAHFLYTLGPAILTSREVKTGRIYPSGRVWAALDLLLTSQTISEARDLTQQRTSQEL